MRSSPVRIRRNLGEGVVGMGRRARKARARKKRRANHGRRPAAG
ncbi:hypothetical protein [Streptosporangium sp. NPDC000563]